MAKEPYPPNGSRTPEACAQRETHWREILARWKKSALSKSKFAQQEKISAFVLTWWDRELRRRDRRQRRAAAHRPKATAKPVPKCSRFIPVRVVRPAPVRPKPVEVVVMGRVIRVLPDFDPETFRRIVHVLEGWPTLAEVQEGSTC